MKKKLMTCLPTAVVVVAITVAISSCQQPAKDNQNDTTESKGTVVAKQTEPGESGYAAINGLEMYYEVYGVKDRYIPD